MVTKKLIAKQNPNADEVPTEILAQSIVSISESMKQLRAGRLNDRALFLLIQHASPGVGQRNNERIPIKDIKAVFEGIANLEAEYLRKKA